MRHRLDIERALELRRQGWRWRAIGEQLAKEAGRRIAYQGNTVCRKVSRHLRAKHDP